MTSIADVKCCALQGVGPVEVTRLLWGLAVLDQLPKPAAAGLYDKLAQMPLTSFTAECLDQILQVLCCAVLCCAALRCAALRCAALRLRVVRLPASIFCV